MLQPAPTLEVSFCEQTELTLPNNSTATRDFGQGALQWGEPDLNFLASLLPGDGPSAPTNVLTVSFDQMTYPVALEGLHTVGGWVHACVRARRAATMRGTGSARSATAAACPSGAARPHVADTVVIEPRSPRRPCRAQIFSNYGFVQKIVIFDKDGKTGALVQVRWVRW